MRRRRRRRVRCRVLPVPSVYFLRPYRHIFYLFSLIRFVGLIYFMSPVSLFLVFFLFNFFLKQGFSLFIGSVFDKLISNFEKKFHSLSLSRILLAGQRRRRYDLIDPIHFPI